ncbi:MAG: protease HtpX [Kiritimatiellae bacterium]|nr:protease HtpX [Kiritimatiellia bacterium]
MKRILLFLATNILVLLTLGIVSNLLCVFVLQTSLAELVGPDFAVLMAVAFVYGFLGAFVSLLISKPLAKFACGAKTVTGGEGPAERWLVDTVRQLAERANVGMPEVAIYAGAPNAFATGAFRNRSLVAVSTGIMEQLTKEELKAVLGHELSHVANGDMVTMTLVQGVLNAFVIFLSRALAYVIASAGRGEGRRRGTSGLYYPLVFAFDLALGVLASLLVFAYSRRREYRADAGSASLLGTSASMIAALKRLGNLKPGVLPDSLKAMGVAEGRRHASLWSTHPSLEDRIAALERWTMAV